jgi:DNA-binding LacI/PurR family transcriptional regulator
MEAETATPKISSEALYDVLCQRITSGDYKVNERIPTERALARAFGCTCSTVSKAMARLVHDGLVERKTRAGTRVLRNKPTRETSRPQLDAVAFVYPSEQHEGIWRIVQGFQRAAHASQRRIVMLTTGTDFHKEGEIVGRLDEFSVKGAVVYPVLPEPKDRLYFAQMLQACRFPVVLVDASMPGFGASAVVVDGLHAGYTMTRHLLAQGLRKIGFLANGAWVPSVQNRYGGYRWALEEAGIEAQPGWAFLEPSMHPDFEHPLEKTHAFTKRFLEHTRGLEGVVCSDDFLALSCLGSARELGLRVPEELKVVGLGDYAASDQREPSLTTYHIPFEEMGRKAFQTLDALLNTSPMPECETRIRGEIVIRQSA